MAEPRLPRRAGGVAVDAVVLLAPLGLWANPPPASTTPRLARIRYRSAVAPGRGRPTTRPSSTTRSSSGELSQQRCPAAGARRRHQARHQRRRPCRQALAREQRRRASGRPAARPRTKPAGVDQARDSSQTSSVFTGSGTAPGARSSTTRRSLDVERLDLDRAADLAARPLRVVVGVVRRAGARMPSFSAV